MLFWESPANQTIELFRYEDVLTQVQGFTQHEGSNVIIISGSKAHIQTFFSLFACLRCSFGVYNTALHHLSAVPAW